MKKHAFALLLSLIVALAFVPCRLAIAAKNDTPIFNDGFETGFSTWTGTNGQPNIVTQSNGSVNTGLYAMMVNSPSQYCYYNLSQYYTSLDMRAYVNFSSLEAYQFYIESAFGLYDHAQFDWWGDTGGLRVDIGNNGSSAFLELNDLLDNRVNSTNVPTTNTWHCIEINWTRSATASLWLDGTLLLTVSTGAYSVDRAYVGQLKNLDPGNPVVNIDDIVVDNSYIGMISSDITPPTYESISTSTNVAGSSCTFNSLISDDTNVSTYIFSTNNTGTWTNDTATAFSNFYNSTSAWANVTKTLNDTVGNTVSYLWYANDTSNNWSSSDQYNLTLTAPYMPTLQMTPKIQTCRKYGETFTLNLTISNPVDVTSLEFEIHYNSTLLNCSSITWTAWGTGTITVDQTNGVINGSTSGTPLNDNQTLIGIQFTATYHHIWKAISGWTNYVNDTIFIQSANLTSASKPDLTYVRGTINQINIGPDVTYTFSPIRGDVNNDGQVDLFDLVAVASYYDQSSDTYNLVGDPIIDIYDLVVVASNFGYKY